MEANNQIILASASGARAELLRTAGFDFLIKPAMIHEPAPAVGESLRRYLTRLAQLKALAVAEKFPRATVLAADTALCRPPACPSADRRLRIMGKPGNAARARRMLRELAGREHFAGTGICVIMPASAGGRRRARCGFAAARVRLRALTSREIQCYIARAQPWRYAGAYALQGAGASIITNIRGDPGAIIGLPLAQTIRLLFPELSSEPSCEPS